jgi:bacillithiol biosynthesis deacetylase BshB1
MLDILVVAPHPDDAELGMGGAILRFKAEGLRVGIVDLTSGEPTPHGDLATRAAETAAASQVLGIDWRHNLGLPNRSLTADLESRRALAGVFRRTRPKWIFAPYWVDAHPDHLAAVELAEAARFWAKLTKSDLPGAPHHSDRVLHYYSVHLRLVAQPSFVLDISPYWEAKRRAIECYQSQFMLGRPQASPTFIDRLRDQAAYWGWSISTQYAEPFASREPVGLTSLRDFL